MTYARLMHELDQLGIKLRRGPGDKIVVSPASKMTPELKEGIAENRETLIRMLHEEENALRHLQAGWQPFPKENKK